MSGHQTSEEILLTLPASMYRIVQTYLQRTLNFTLCIEMEEQRAIYLHLKFFIRKSMCLRMKQNKDKTHN